MPVMQFETSVAAGASNNNFLSGSAFEFARQRQIVSLGIVAAATGTFVTIQSGSDVLLEESPPMVLTTMPIVPDHFFYNDVMEVGDRLKVAARNPTGGAVIHRGIVQVNPL
jgi:hypothetical protein